MSCRSGWEEAEGLGLVEECAGGGGVLGCCEQGVNRRNASSMHYPRAESRLPPQPCVVVLSCARVGPSVLRAPQGCGGSGL